MAATDVPEPMAKLFAQIDKNKKHYIDNLAKAVAIKSVSAWPETRAEITTMMTWMGEELKGLGASIEYSSSNTIFLYSVPKGSTLLNMCALLFQAKKTCLFWYYVCAAYYWKDMVIHSFSFHF